MKLIRKGIKNFRNKIEHCTIILFIQKFTRFPPATLHFNINKNLFYPKNYLNGN